MCGMLTDNPSATKMSVNLNYGYLNNKWVWIWIMGTWTTHGCESELRVPEQHMSVNLNYRYLNNTRVWIWITGTWTTHECESELRVPEQQMSVKLNYGYQNNKCVNRMQHNCMQTASKTLNKSIIDFMWQCLRCQVINTAKVIFKRHQGKKTTEAPLNLGWVWLSWYSIGLVSH